MNIKINNLPIISDNIISKNAMVYKILSTHSCLQVDGEHIREQIIKNKTIAILYIIYSPLADNLNNFMFPMFSVSNGKYEMNYKFKMVYLYKLTPTFIWNDTKSINYLYYY